MNQNDFIKHPYLHKKIISSFVVKPEWDPREEQDYRVLVMDVKINVNRINFVELMEVDDDVHIQAVLDQINSTANATSMEVANLVSFQVGFDILFPYSIIYLKRYLDCSSKDRGHGKRVE